MTRGECQSAMVDGIECLVWKDNKAVALINNISIPGTPSTVLRRNGGTRSAIQCPESVKLYNGRSGYIRFPMQNIFLQAKVQEMVAKIILLPSGCRNSERIHFIQRDRRHQTAYPQRVPSAACCVHDWLYELKKATFRTRSSSC